MENFNFHPSNLITKPIPQALIAGNSVLCGIPFEIQLKIFSCCGLKDFANLQLTCKQLHVTSSNILLKMNCLVNDIQIFKESMSENMELKDTKFLSDMKIKIRVFYKKINFLKPQCNNSEECESLSLKAESDLNQLRNSYDSLVGEFISSQSGVMRGIYMRMFYSTPEFF